VTQMCVSRSGRDPVVCVSRESRGSDSRRSHRYDSRLGYTKDKGGMYAVFHTNRAQLRNFSGIFLSSSEVDYTIMHMLFVTSLYVFLAIFKNDVRSQDFQKPDFS